MNDQTELIRLLNEDLSLELGSIVQYVNHIATIKGAEYQQTLNELAHHVNQELSHALILARQIDFLGGEPTTDVQPVQAGTDPESALREDLLLEESQLERYRERVDQAVEAGLPDVAEALAPVLQDTQHHIRDLRSALGA